MVKNFITKTFLKSSSQSIKGPGKTCKWVPVHPPSASSRHPSLYLPCCLFSKFLFTQVFLNSTPFMTFYAVPPPHPAKFNPPTSSNTSTTPKPLFIIYRVRTLFKQLFISTFLYFEVLK